MVLCTSGGVSLITIPSVKTTHLINNQRNRQELVPPPSLLITLTQVNPKAHSSSPSRGQTAFPRVTVDNPVSSKATTKIKAKGKACWSAALRAQQMTCRDEAAGDGRVPVAALGPQSPQGSRAAWWSRPWRAVTARRETVSNGPGHHCLCQSEEQMNKSINY